MKIVLLFKKMEENKITFWGFEHFPISVLKKWYEGFFGIQIFDIKFLEVDSWKLYKNPVPLGLLELRRNWVSKRDLR